MRSYSFTVGAVCAGMVLGALSVAQAFAQDAAEPARLAKEAQGFFKKFCAECHHGKDPTSGVDDFDVLDYASVTKRRIEKDKAFFYVKPGAKGDESLQLARVWKRAGVANQLGSEGDMPPEDADKHPTNMERQSLLRRWIEAGAPAWPQDTVAAAELPTKEPANEGELWLDVRMILELRCMKCHDGPAPQSGVNQLQIVDYQSLTKKRTAEDRSDRITDWERSPWHYVKPGATGEEALDESLLWSLVKSDKMPRGSEKLSAAEKAILKAWISAGAPSPAAPLARENVSRQSQLAAIRAHLQSTPLPDRPYQRYFSFAHLHNNASIYEKELNAYRAGFAKLVNSLSWKKELVIPATLPETQATVLVVDLRKLGWEENGLWVEVERNYPYIFADASQDAVQIKQLSGATIPVLAADWFITKASRPPLYHRFLQLPETAAALEAKLGIDFLANFREGKLARAGYLGASTTTSGFRVVERQPITTYEGAYWKSYDFGSGELARDDHRLRNPLLHALGPKFKDHPNEYLAFQHDGCEVIYNLPNGLQGYLVVDGDGARADAPPIWVLKDKNEFSGTPQLVNGISCMACHSNGMHTVSDQVLRQADGRQTRDATSAAGPASELLRKFYRPKAEMDAFLKQDEKRFMDAMTAVSKPFLADAEGRIQWPKTELIYGVTLRYRQHLTLQEATRELDYPDTAKLKADLTENPKLLKGLGIQDRLLQDGGKISREEWTNVFSEVVRRLKEEKKE